MDSENDCQFRMPLINDDAPAFKAVTTQGEISFPEDYKGKWVILFSHPADFTPVCTTEFMTFASMIDEFKSLNTELIGLSVDSLYAHIAWLRKIQELEWNGIKGPEVTFPLIEDIRMDVARKYGFDGRDLGIGESMEAGNYRITRVKGPYDGNATRKSSTSTATGKSTKKTASNQRKPSKASGTKSRASTARASPSKKRGARSTTGGRR